MLEVTKQDDLPDQPAFTKEVVIDHGRASRKPTPARPAVEISVNTSVDSDATLPTIESIIPVFVDHPDADTELEVNHRPHKNEHQDMA